MTNLQFNIPSTSKYIFYGYLIYENIVSLDIRLLLQRSVQKNQLIILFLST